MTLALLVQGRNCRGGGQACVNGEKGERAAVRFDGQAVCWWMWGWLVAQPPPHSPTRHPWTCSPPIPTPTLRPLVTDPAHLHAKDVGSVLRLDRQRRPAQLGVVPQNDLWEIHSQGTRIVSMHAAHQACVPPPFPALEAAHLQTVSERLKPHSPAPTRQFQCPTPGPRAKASPMSA